MLIKLSVHRQNGSLLLEALLVIVILSVGLTFIIQSLSSSLRALSISKSYAQAAFLTDNKLSEILLKKTSTKGLSDSGNFQEPFNDFNYQFSTSASKLSVEDFKSDLLDQVNLTVTWKNGKNQRELNTSLCLLNPAEDEQTQP